ncbi:MAG TPA: site-2 protease family protein [Nocardioidaceae bacterium]|nr:site-2 protease family protein [Nocardioidaceae bacterium]
MTALMYTLGVVLFALGLAASIGLHEVGHMVPAKKFGVKVTQYFVGFGRTLWSTKRGETEYGLKAIPLGGYVKLVGMLPPGRGEEGGRIRKSNTGMFTQLISDARAAEYELVEPGDEDRLFYKLPWWKKVIVMSGGPMVNLVLAFLLFGGVFMLHGAATPTTTVAEVSDCVIAATPAAVDQEERECTPADPIAPAKAAGLQVGDRLVSFNGTEVDSWDQMTGLIRANRDGEATIVVERDGEQITTQTNTTVSPRPESGDNPGRIVQVGFLGVEPTIALERQGPVFVVTTMGDYTWETVKAIGALPVRLAHAGMAAVGMEERAADSPMSVVGASRVAGEFASDERIPVGSRFISLLMLLGGVNLFVGMLNFIPLLPLDGGHIAGALYEAVRRAFAKLFRRPDPGYFDVAKLLPVAYVMAAVFLVMTVVLVFADIVAPVRIG